MESIERLRDELRICETCGARPTIAAMSAYADAIEQELAEQYVALPLDADGVPIHVGDEVTFTNGDRSITRTVEAIGETWVVFGDATFYGVRSCRHRQPDTWERIIEDAMQLGYTDPDNEHLMGRIVARCRALAGEVGE